VAAFCDLGARRAASLLRSAQEEVTMVRIQRLGLALIVVALLIVRADIALAQSAKDLVGTWQLVSNVIDQGGKKIDQFGPNPHGILYFESNGALVIVRDGLPKFANNGRLNGTPEENKAVVEGSIAHFGPYSVRGNSIVFNVDHSTFPNWGRRRAAASVHAEG
jgi:hypothetical protein